MSVAAGMPAVLLPADPGFRESRDRDTRFGRLRRAAIAAALLAHVAVIVALVVRWPAFFTVAPPQRPIAVTLVTEPPPTAPAPKAHPSPPPSLGHELVSGADNETTAPPKAAEKGPEAAPKPLTPPPEVAQSKTAVPESKPTPAEVPRPPKPKLATRETAPTEARGSVNRAPGTTEHQGDPYLNHLWELVEQHRFYPTNAVGPLGLRLEGTAVYLIAIASDGSLQGAELERSAGADVLDAAALKMIRDAAPFPPPPSYYPRPGVVLEVTIHLFPGATG